MYDFKKNFNTITLLIRMRMFVKLQCAQVSITRLGDMSMVSSQVVESLVSIPVANDTTHRFSLCCGKNIVLKNNNLTAARVRHYNNAVVFSSTLLEIDEVFEVIIHYIY